MRLFFAAYLLNALWQVPLLFSVAALQQSLLRRQSLRFQHTFWTIALLGSVLLPAVTFNPAELLPLLHAWWKTPISAPGGRVAVTFSVTPIVSSLHLPAWLVAPTLIIYSLVTASFLLRFVRQAFAIRKLQREAHPSVLTASTAFAWQLCCEHFHVDGATLAESPQVRNILTFGLRRPWILLPQGFLQQVDEVDLLAALAHEAAHIQRRDYARNLLLELATLPVTCLPGTAWAKRQLAGTREMLCDQDAAVFLNGRQAYARSLLRLAADLASVPPLTSLHAIGFLDANTLERRLMYLSQSVLPLRRRLTLVLGGCICFALAGTGFAASALRIPITASPGQQPTEQPKTVRIASGVIAGQVLTRVNPIYPPEAKAAHITGSVVLDAIIDETGTVQKLTVLSGPQELQGSALDAVRQWTYKPFLLNGDPVAVQTTITVNYQLEN